MKFKNGIITFIYGMVLGVSLLPPGFSVATMAVILDIYDSLINLLSDLFSKNFLKTIKPITFLGCGAVIGIFLFSSVINFLLNILPMHTLAFFLGLIIASLPLISKQTSLLNEKIGKDSILFIISFFVAVSFILLQNTNLFEFTNDFTFIKILSLIFVGMIVSFSMVLPGLSGALILMLLGGYQFLLYSVSNLNFPVISLVIIGALLGLAVSGKILGRMIENSKQSLYALSFGLIAGSIPVIFVNEVWPHMNPNEILSYFDVLLVCFLGYKSLKLTSFFKKESTDEDVLQQ